MKAEILKQKKITLATLKAFIKNAKELFVIQKSSFDGMIDGISENANPKVIPVSKENAIGHRGVWLTQSRNYFKYVETETHYGINVYNCCGEADLLTLKNQIKIN